jgi:hypothetical protein
MDTNYASAVRNLSEAAAAQHLYDVWLENWKKSAALANDREDLEMAEEAARVYAKSGIHAALTRTVELELRLAKRRYVDPADIAFKYAELGEKDQAFFWLEKGYAEKSDLTAYVKTEWRMESLRSDPRYAALLKKMGLPQ